MPDICAATPPELRAELAAWVEGLLVLPPPIPYLWGGESLEGCDCSGFVCLACRQLSTPLPLGRPTADVLWQRLEHVEKPEPGDLAEYGHPDRAHPAHHVMVCLEGGRVAGMSGGNETVRSVAIARIVGAELRAFASPHYRADLLGFARIPFYVPV